MGGGGGGMMYGGASPNAGGPGYSSDPRGGYRRSDSSEERLLRYMHEMMSQMHDMSKMLYQVPVNKNNKMSKVGNMMQRLLDKDTQKMVKAGFINGDLELTDLGKKVLWAIIFSANKAEFVKEADLAIEEAKDVK